MRRTPAVAGQFYYAQRDRLEKQVKGFIEIDLTKEYALAVLSPHAGLIYSGSVAGAVYSSIEFPETFVLIGPNHTGLGEAVSIWAEGQWEIPTGVFDVDEKLSKKILQNVSLIKKDTQAHLFEHSLEVQLPFIRYFKEDVKIVPITIMSATLEELKLIGEGIAKAIKDIGYKVIITASSDMSHYVSDTIARQKDHLAIERLLALDGEGLYNIVRKENITMCGYMPAVVMLYAVVALGGKSARLVKYTTSGEVSGDYEHVVGYAGVIIK